MHKTSLLAAALLLLTAGSASADVVGLKTNLAAGAEMTLALNADLSATLTWSNGDSETVTFDGTPKTYTVKSDSLTITSVSGNITRLYAPADGIVSINTTGATALTKLFLPGNALTALNLSKNTALTDLDVQGNTISDLNISSCRKIVNLNVAGNKLDAISYATVTPMKTLVVADNNIDTLRYQASMANLEALICQNNHLRTLNLKNTKSLRRLVASGNDITSVTAGVMNKLTDLWLDNNALTTLDISAGTGVLQAVAVDNNKLTDITWDDACAGTLAIFYGHNNGLFFNSFPSRTSKMTAVFAPQEPYYYTDKVNIEESKADLVTLLTTNGFGKKGTRTYVLTNAAGDTLKRGKDADYYNLTSGWTFYTAQKGLTIHVASSAYPGVQLALQPFDVVDPTGISAPVTTGEALTVSTAAGTLTVTATAATHVSVVGIDGRTAVSENISAGTHTWSLPAGLYIVGGHKVVVP